MAGDRKAWLIILNDFAHDLFSGFWLSCVILVYLLDRKIASLDDGAAAVVLHEVLRTFFWFILVSLGAVLTTGAVRSATYQDPVNTDETGTRKRLLIIKHIILGLVFIGGTWFAYSVAFP